MKRTVTILSVLLVLTAWGTSSQVSSLEAHCGLFGISGIIPDKSYFDELRIDVATSGFWIGASQDFFGGAKEELHTRQFREFADKGLTPIGTLYLGDVDEEAAYWAEQIVRHYSQGQGAADVGTPVLYWELGDEQNGSWGTACAPAEYARRVSVLGPAIRRGCPECSVVMGGLLDGPEMGDWALAPYLETFLNTGAGKWIDIYAFHYYGLAQPSPVLPQAQRYDSAQTIVAKMRSLLALYDEAGSPIWVTETCTFSGGMGSIEQSESDQAADLVKRYLTLWALGVDVVQWCYLTEPQYEGTGVGFFDQSGLIYDGKGPYDGGEGVKKRAYFAYIQMLDLLHHASLMSHHTEDGVTTLSFGSTDIPVTVLWQDPWIREGPVWIRTDGEIELVGLCGEELGTHSGWIRIALSLEPVYLLGEIATVSLAAPPLQSSEH
ncbi:hypothetical protein KKG90_06645 [Candidatus Bipolaricaulota bacterium]|nr:hypothetical protein [Candidatus Bipolaricaulota bacterium]